MQLSAVSSCGTVAEFCHNYATISDQKPQITGGNMAVQPVWSQFVSVNNLLYQGQIQGKSCMLRLHSWICPAQYSTYKHFHEFHRSACLRKNRELTGN